DAPIAHPLFSVCYEWPAVLALRAKAVRESWALLGVHSTHHVVIHRPPTVADRLLTRAQIIAVRPSRAGTLVVARLSTVDRNGRPVTTTDYGSVYRGVATGGGRRRAAAAARPPRAAGLVRDGLERAGRGRPAGRSHLFGVRPYLEPDPHRHRRRPLGWTDGADPARLGHPGAGGVAGGPAGP